jgi:L-lysine exporter family protein LysE/ArgO
MQLFFEGFILQASLILALGAQNLFVLESGLRKRRHLLVATLCTACDAFLIALGVLGAATAFVQFPWMKMSLGVLGVSFLAYYGILKLREKPSIENYTSSTVSASIGVVIGQTLAFSLLNPHVYLDTVILIGGYSAKFPGVADRAQFGAGASSFSLIWFFSLAFFATLLRPYLNNAKAMKRISFVSGVILLALAIKLGMQVGQWYLGN